jgi:hypothetical protein
MSKAGIISPEIDHCPLMPIAAWRVAGLWEAGSGSTGKRSNQANIFRLTVPIQQA